MVLLLDATLEVCKLKLKFLGPFEGRRGPSLKSEGPQVGTLEAISGLRNQFGQSWPKMSSKWPNMLSCSEVVLVFLCPARRPVMGPNCRHDANMQVFRCFFVLSGSSLKPKCASNEKAAIFSIICLLLFGPNKEAREGPERQA